MRRRCRVQDERARVADVGEVREDLALLHGGDPLLEASFEANRKHGARAIGHVFLLQVKVTAAWKACIRYPLHLRMVRQPRGHLFGAVAMPLHAQRERLDTGDGEEGIERGHGRAEVPQRNRVRERCVSQISERFLEREPVVRRLRRGERREFVVLHPIELATVDHRASHGVAVSGEEFRRRVHDQVRAVLDGLAQVWGRHGVVDNQRDAVRMGNLGKALDIGDGTPGIGQGFGPDTLDGSLARLDGCGDRVQVIDINEIAVPVELLERLSKLRDRASIELVRRDHGIPRLH
mmetsp:Transcript_28409/g.55263  ORF Transcript_28409/g.55263 Transcript_28409/m.55263 type:complete len:292 (+) Transcript_28409:159-1034(+)